jgi:chromosome partitioning protein
VLVLAVVNLKGGVGKSTIAINLAVALHRAGHRTLLVDTDGQGTCRRWSQIASQAELDGPPVVAIAGGALRRDLERIGGPFDVVMLDTPGHFAEEARAAMLVAHVVVMPILAGGPDVWALEEHTLPVVVDVCKIRPELRTGVVINKSGKTTLANDTREALGKLGVTVFGELGDRVAFGKAIVRGQGVVDFEPNGPAAEQVNALLAAVLGTLRDRTEGKQATNAAEKQSARPRSRKLSR